MLEDQGPILVRQWFYRGASGPEYLVFDDLDEFVQFLEERTWAGDAIEVWSVRDVRTSERRIVEGKYADDNWEVPKGGAY